jgi:hypothetical protein
MLTQYSSILNALGSIPQERKQNLAIVTAQREPETDPY